MIGFEVVGLSFWGFFFFFFFFFFRLADVLSPLLIFLTGRALHYILTARS